MLAHAYKNKRIGNTRSRFLSLIQPPDEKLVRASSVVDKLYEDYHDKRRSEKVLRIIDNALNSGENVVITPNVTTTKTTSFIDKEHIEDEQRLSKMLIDITSMMKDLHKLDMKENTAKTIRDRNKLRKRYTKAVDKYQREVLDNQAENRKSQVNLGIQTNCKDKNVLKKRYKKAVTKYRCEIFQERWKKEKRRTEYQNERMCDLEDVIVDLKLENCSLTTETEALRFQVSHLENHFLEVEELFGNLSTKMDDKFVSYQERITKAFDKLFECQIKIKKKRKFFGRK